MIPKGKPASAHVPRVKTPLNSEEQRRAKGEAARRGAERPVPAGTLSGSPLTGYDTLKPCYRAVASTPHRSRAQCGQKAPFGSPFFAEARGRLLTLDVITKNLAVTLSTTLSETLSERKSMSKSNLPESATH